MKSGQGKKRGLKTGRVFRTGNRCKPEDVWRWDEILVEGGLGVGGVVGRTGEFGRRWSTPEERYERGRERRHGLLGQKGRDWSPGEVVSKFLLP